MNKRLLMPLVAAGIFAGALIFSLVRFAMSPSCERCVFYFSSYDSDDYYAEVRYLNKDKNRDMLNYFVDEFLLGPMTNRLKEAFPEGTRVEFCIRQGDDLHLGLSKNALMVDSVTFDIKKNLELLRYNIVNNFTNLNKIFIYIDGKSVTTEG